MGDSFLEDLSRPRPDPGGGAAAAHGALLGVALLHKVVRLEAGRRQGYRPSDPPAGPPSPSRRFPWDQALKKVQEFMETLKQLRHRDVQAYSQLSRAGSSGQAEEMLAAVREAVRSPGKIMEHSAAALALLSEAGTHCRRHLVSDLLVACEFLGAAIQGAYHIASANLQRVKTAAERKALAQEIHRACQPGLELYQRVKVELVARENGLDDCS
jgi:formiminotetrahydrofolate cyclodeaminase